VGCLDNRRGHRLISQANPTSVTVADRSYRGKTVTKPLSLNPLGLPLSEKQIPQVVEKVENE
jgi:hypothetical protein